MRWAAIDGFTLWELLLAMLLVLLFAGGIAGALAAAAQASVAFPQAADEQQRLRAVMDQVAGWLAAAGQGVAGVGPNAGGLLVPVLYPQRRGVSAPDADDSAFADRVTVVAGTDPPAGGRLGSAMPTASAPIVVDTASCGPGRVACGFTAGVTALVADALATGQWFSVSRVSGSSVEHSPTTLAAAFSPLADAVVTAVTVRAIVFDRARRQLRLVTPGSDLPLVDGIADFAVRWFAASGPPGGPIPPAGQGSCVVSANGTPALEGLDAGAGPWFELEPAQMRDGPWCGTVPWRFDADLLRVRLLRVRLRLERLAIAGTGSGTDPDIEFSVAPRNLVRFKP